MGAVPCQTGGLMRYYTSGKKHYSEALEENNLQKKVELLISSGMNFVHFIKNIAHLPPRYDQKNKLLKIKVKLAKICEFLRNENIVKILNKADINHKADFENQILLLELQERFSVFHEVIRNFEF